MATTTPRRMLIFKIQKRLLALSISQLQMVASAIDDRSGLDAEALSERELLNLIVDYLKSEKLKHTEDEGLARILRLDDTLDQLVKAPDWEDADEGGMSEGALVQAEDTKTRRRNTSNTAPVDGRPQSSLGESDVGTLQLATEGDGNVPIRNLTTSSPSRSIADSAAYTLPDQASLSSSVD
ncbi:uncharacterized protein LOC130923660 isoform X2 [Corythoichthys intestinalis]|uniref:uncharacterized protein LOC130923660 isoform X2 n=1 Tax=Corythoichthys intestinalis TaxID=161448 RepID=UPI0025A56B14|nr:uncharacterized protein LOC130923660 isoform X2 [Corythoichthys intestinalis]